MTESHQVPTTLVVGDRVVHVRLERSGAPRSMIVNIEVDYERSWLFDEPGWQDVALGVAEGTVYWWSARHLVVLPTGEQGEPVVFPTDEDIRLAFAVPDGWVVVCETSVRLVIEGEEVSRLELGEVVLAARWEGLQLVVGDASGHDTKVVVSDGRLVI